MGRATQEAAGEDRGSFPGDDEHEEDNSVSEAEAIPEAKQPKTMRKPHLPDELFEAASSSKAGKRKVEEDEVPLDLPPKKAEIKVEERYCRWVGVVSECDLVCLPDFLCVVSDSTTPPRHLRRVTRFLKLYEYIGTSLVVDMDQLLICSTKMSVDNVVLSASSLME